MLPPVTVVVASPSPWKPLRSLIQERECTGLNPEVRHVKPSSSAAHEVLTTTEVHFEVVISGWAIQQVNLGRICCRNTK